ncbi:MAG: succinate dehydrogenase/fumarate reductase iron-sulfur subunit [Deltaproteobacteria bacterium]|nr:MAG: succinate dehydrogenase/fumarate reductase iron-sulfur subunit [Deltaproteobacteria bacterium]
MSSRTINLTLRVWRQTSPDQAGRFEKYEAKDVSTDASFLEMLDQVNEELVNRGEEPIAFEHDCREGICGTCGIVINGMAHGPQHGTTTCQLHMRQFRDGETLTLEPWRARGFPVLKDLAVDRAAFDRIMAAGGYNSVNVGNAPDANSILVSRTVASDAFDAATCIGCGACVAACPNASAMLFVAAKVGHLATLPQGQPEATKRAKRMVDQMDIEGFGACTNTLECEAACPKEISTKWIQKMNRLYLKAALISDET